jgi:hypothetical protein
LTAKPHPGREPWLSKRQTKQLVKLLLRGARQYAMNSPIGTVYGKYRDIALNNADLRDRP